MRAGDIMSRPAITVGEDATVQQMANLMAERRIGAVIVVDAEGRAVGTVTVSDLLYKVAHFSVPPHIEILGSIIYLQTPHQMEERLQKVTGLVAADLMSDKLISAAENTAVENVADLMIDRKVHRIPILRDGRPVGLLTRADIIRHTLARQS